MQNTQRNKPHLNQAHQLMIMVIEGKEGGFSTDPSLPSNTSPTTCENYLVDEAAVVEEDDDDDDEEEGDSDQVAEHDGRAAEVELDVGDRRKRNRTLLSDQDITEGNKRRFPRLRGPNITMEEDIALCKAFVSVTIRDAMAGSQQQQQTSTLWGRVIEAFDVLYPNVYNRPINTLQHRFGLISKEVSEFACRLAQVESRRQSGWTDADVMQQARSKFQALNNNKAFQFEDCYEVLKDLPKFSSSSTTMKTGFSQQDDRICSPSTLAAHKSNLKDSGINSKVPLERNPEREVEKERLKKKVVVGSDKISAILDEARARNACFMERMKKKRSEIDRRLIELEREEREHEQWKCSIDRRLLHEHDMQKLESEQQKQESRIMSMDLNTLSDVLQVRYFKSRQEEIMARRRTNH